MLVVDIEGALSSIDPDQFYLAAAAPGSPQELQLVDGAQLLKDSSRTAVATVLFLCRPPNRESAITSAELLQL